MRAAILISIALLYAGGCATGDEQKTHDRQLLPVTLPDLSRLEESVQAQLRERYAALTAKRGDSRTAASDLATEYGEMGKLLLAAELLDPAEAALLNAQALAADAMTWPYYSVTCTERKATSRRRPSRSNGRCASVRATCRR